MLGSNPNGAGSSGEVGFLFSPCAKAVGLLAYLSNAFDACLHSQSFFKVLHIDSHPYPPHNP